MRTKRLVAGLSNTQKIRVIVDGVGFNTTVQGAFDMCFQHQRIAVTSTLINLGADQSRLGKKSTGIVQRKSVYKHDGSLTDVDVQIDLILI